jgi:DedD protein
MATRSDVPDLAVDELRRRARRRLVGAIVLALAAAVLLPLLLENEPKPLGDDVSIQIPPIDSGKFINPLSPGKTQDPKAKGSIAMGPNDLTVGAQPAAAPGAAVPASPSNAESEPRTPAAPASAQTPEAKTTDATNVAKESATAAKESAAGAKESTAAPGREAALEAKATSEAKPMAKTDAAQGASSSGYVVQVAAFSDRYGARSLVTKLKRGGFPGYTEEVATDKGTLHRVRVGPYASREAAATALAKLKAAGFNGMVAHVG